MRNDYAEIIGKVFDIIDEAEYKIVSKGSEECFNKEGYLLQKVHEDLIRLVGKSERRYVEYQSDTIDSFIKAKQ